MKSYALIRMSPFVHFQFVFLVTSVSARRTNETFRSVLWKMEHLINYPT